MPANALRGQPAEFGLIAPKGKQKLPELHALARSAPSDRLPDLVRRCVAPFDGLKARLRQIEQALLTWHRTNEASQRLATIPGIGLTTATVIAATVTDPSAFRSGRGFAD